MIKHYLNDRLRAVEQRCCARENAMSRSLRGANGARCEALHAGI